MCGTDLRRSPLHWTWRFLHPYPSQSHSSQHHGATSVFDVVFGYKEESRILGVSGEWLLKKMGFPEHDHGPQVVVQPWPWYCSCNKCLKYLPFASAEWFKNNYFCLGHISHLSLNFHISWKWGRSKYAFLTRDHCDVKDSIKSADSWQRVELGTSKRWINLAVPDQHCLGAGVVVGESLSNRERVRQLNKI